MWPDRVSNLGPLALESDALPTALHGPAKLLQRRHDHKKHLLLSCTNGRYIMLIAFRPLLNKAKGNFFSFDTRTRTRYRGYLTFSV